MQMLLLSIGSHPQGKDTLIEDMKYMSRKQNLSKCVLKKSGIMGEPVRNMFILLFFLHEDECAVIHIFERNIYVLWKQYLNVFQ